MGLEDKMGREGERNSSTRTVSSLDGTDSTSCFAEYKEVMSHVSWVWVWSPS